MDVTGAQSLVEARMAMARKLGTTRADHSWVDAAAGGCGACQPRSLFRYFPEFHPYVIEEEPS